MLTLLQYIHIFYNGLILLLLAGLLYTRNPMYKLLYIITLVSLLVSLLIVENIAFLALFLGVIYFGGILIFILFILLSLRFTQQSLNWGVLSPQGDLRIVVLIGLLLLIVSNKETIQLYQGLIPNLTLLTSYTINSLSLKIKHSFNIIDSLYYTSAYFIGVLTQIFGLIGMWGFNILDSWRFNPMKKDITYFFFISNPFFWYQNFYNTEILSFRQILYNPFQGQHPWFTYYITLSTHRASYLCYYSSWSQYTLINLITNQQPYSIGGYNLWGILPETLKANSSFNWMNNPLQKFSNIVFLGYNNRSLYFQYLSVVYNFVLGLQKLIVSSFITTYPTKITITGQLAIIYFIYFNEITLLIGVGLGLGIIAVTLYLKT